MDTELERENDRRKKNVEGDGQDRTQGGWDLEGEK